MGLGKAFAGKFSTVATVGSFVVRVEKVDRGETPAASSSLVAGVLLSGDVEPTTLRPVGRCTFRDWIFAVDRAVRTRTPG